MKEYISSIVSGRSIVGDDKKRSLNAAELTPKQNLWQLLSISDLVLPLYLWTSGLCGCEPQWPLMCLNIEVFGWAASGQNLFLKNMYATE